MPEQYLFLPIFLVLMLVVIFFIRSNNIITIILLSSVFSFLVVLMYLLLDAPDVAMTEAAVSVLTSVFAFAVIKVKSNDRVFLESTYFEKFNPILMLISLAFAALLIYASTDLPDFGNPSFNLYYLQNTEPDIGIKSVVTAILASYRGYDTLLETLVILIGGLAILLINEPLILKTEPNLDPLVNIMVRFISPFILLFAFYLQLHGEISPGGGFQAGALIASVFILYIMTYGKIISIAKLKLIGISGLIIYLAVGILGLVKQKELLNYNILALDKILGQKIGILIVELGVAMSVSSVLLIIYLSLTNVFYRPKL